MYHFFTELIAVHSWIDFSVEDTCDAALEWVKQGILEGLHFWCLKGIVQPKMKVSEHLFTQRP